MFCWVKYWTRHASQFLRQFESITPFIPTDSYPHLAVPPSGLVYQTSPSRPPSHGAPADTGSRLGPRSPLNAFSRLSSLKMPLTLQLSQVLCVCHPAASSPPACSLVGTFSAHRALVPTQLRTERSSDQTLPKHPGAALQGQRGAALRAQRRSLKACLPAHHTRAVTDVVVIISVVTVNEMIVYLGWLQNHRREGGQGGGDWQSPFRQQVKEKGRCGLEGRGRACDWSCREKIRTQGKGLEPRPGGTSETGRGLPLLSPKGRQFFEVEIMDRFRAGQSLQWLCCSQRRGSGGV